MAPTPAGPTRLWQFRRDRHRHSKLCRTGTGTGSSTDTGTSWGPVRDRPSDGAAPPRVAVLGASGFLGSAVAAMLARRHLRLRLVARAPQRGRRRPARWPTSRCAKPISRREPPPRR
ncbi:oxidoreductase [Streptomyces alboflavus]|uniref:Oxidoreductase n=1 Tax=Streptomyces alboflavus TaxID=67267 RepID=A0A1Z1WQS3_9ACTN|nr:hypothetical protein [Streptomyces alboflavus]ARX88793.1 oxidoreductase [Streptomyces alboflavus]